MRRRHRNRQSFAGDAPQDGAGQRETRRRKAVVPQGKSRWTQGTSELKARCVGGCDAGWCCRRVAWALGAGSTEKTVSPNFSRYAVTLRPAARCLLILRTVAGRRALVAATMGFALIPPRTVAD
jgi:hypothetical protein